MSEIIDLCSQIQVALFRDRNTHTADRVIHEILARGLTLQRARHLMAVCRMGKCYYTSPQVRKAVTFYVHTLKSRGTLTPPIQSLTNDFLECTNELGVFGGPDWPS